MSYKEEEWQKQMIHECLLDCIHQPPTANDYMVKENDPYGLCLKMFEVSKSYPAPIATRKKLLDVLHKAAKELLPSLSSPETQERCKTIIRNTTQDNRAESRRYCKKDTENYDLGEIMKNWD